MTLKNEPSMMRIKILTFFFVLGLALQAGDKPNFLVLMFEDTSDDYLSAFGNTAIETPNFDQLAKDGIMFTNAYSNGPQCSPARSTFIRGMYATTVGAEWHRMDVATPDDFFFPRLLQRAGYKTYLKGKHDFNTPKDHWDKELKIFNGTDYTKCPADVPFYGQYNFFDTHMSRITDTRLKGQRDDRTVFASDIDTLDTYLPHTEWVMDDHAYHLHKITLFDAWLKGQLDKLKATGRADNTIIFVTSDHGGCLPGSKGYIREAGVEVPMIAYFPPKWAHMLPENKDGVCSEIVDFSDLAPTFFSLAGLEKPEHMQGRAICGPGREDPKEFAYSYKANQAPNFIPARAITDLKYKIIWNYNTVFPSGARQDFQWKMPGYRDWEAHWRKGEYVGIYSYFFEPMQAIEFYDLEKDPGETQNLANDPAYAALVEEYKGHLKQMVRESGDLGFFPQSIRAQEFKTKAVYDFVEETSYDMVPVYEAAELASMAEAADVDQLLELMQSPEAVIRYWASVGMLRLRFHNKIKEVPALVKQMANNESENIEVRCINHCTLLSDEQYCEVVPFFRSQMTNAYCKGIIHNMGDKLRPVAAELYKGFETSNFYTRSLLINAGVLPYEELIDHPDLTIDSVLIEQSDTLDCQPEACNELIHDDFSTGNDLSQWKEIPTTDMMSLQSGALCVLFDKEKANVTARRSFDAVMQKASFSIKYKSDNGTSRTYFSLLNDNEEPVAAFLLGTLEQVNGAFVISALNDVNAKVEKSNIKAKTKYIGDFFTKDIYYNIVFDVDFVAQTFAVTVDGKRSDDFPLIQPSTSIKAFDAYVEKMYSSGEAAYFDDFVVEINTQEKNELIALIDQCKPLLYGEYAGLSTSEARVEAWQNLNRVFLQALELVKLCNASETTLKALTDSLQDALDAYQKVSAIGLSESHPAELSDFILPDIFYAGNAYYLPRFQQKPQSLLFEIFTLKGQKLFSSTQYDQGWQGELSAPVYVWRLNYQLPGQTPQSVGKVMVFVD